MKICQKIYINSGIDFFCLYHLSLKFWYILKNRLLWLGPLHMILPCGQCTNYWIIFRFHLCKPSTCTARESDMCFVKSYEVYRLCYICVWTLLSSWNWRSHASEQIIYNSLYGTIIGTCIIILVVSKKDLFCYFRVPGVNSTRSL
jgi:hypothetical protein